MLSLVACGEEEATTNATSIISEEPTPNPGIEPRTEDNVVDRENEVEQSGEESNVTGKPGYDTANNTESTDNLPQTATSEEAGVPENSNTNNSETETAEPADYIAEYRAEEGYLAPDFTVTLIDGTTMTLSALQGTPVILNFWATWCGPCCAEMPAFEQLQAEYGSNLVVLAIDCGEDLASVSNFANSNGYTFRIGLDQDGTIGNLYPTTGIPYTVIIDSYGVIRHISVGASDASTMYEFYKECIDSL